MMLGWHETTENDCIILDFDYKFLFGDCVSSVDDHGNVDEVYFVFWE